MRYLTIFLLTTRLWAQAFTPNDLPWLAQKAPQSFTAPLPYLWWIYTNTSFGNPVSTWADFEQGAQYAEGNASIRPTASADGIVFAGSQLLSNAVLNFSVSNVTCMIILKVTTFGPQGDVLDDPTGGAYWMFGSAVANKFGYQGTDIFNGLTNIPQDLIFNLYNSSPGGVVTGNFYTNGVQVTAPSYGNYANNQLLINLGGYNGGANGFVGKIYEVAFWTNNWATNTTWVAQWHNRNTNTYNAITP